VTGDCGPHPALVGAKLWLPAEPYEYGWAPLVGCNRMRCQRCREPVRAQVLQDGEHRRYACGCQQHEEIWHHQVDADPGDLIGPSRWTCEGHPGFALPATLDGVALTQDSDWAAVARLGLVRPPFTPPGVELAPSWILRLYRLLASEPARRQLGTAVADAMNDPDAVVVAGALGFFINEPDAPGAERLAELIRGRRAWLEATAHPARPGSSLLASAAIALHERLLVIDDAGRPVDGPALTLAKTLALEGIGPGGAPHTFRDYDPDWLWGQAANLVRARVDWLGLIIFLLAGTPPGPHVRVVRAIAGLSPEIRRLLRAEITGSFDGPGQGALLSALGSVADERGGVTA
jgi:hypothetical protein